MTSIRLSLIAYFLLILAVALGAVMGLLYQTTADALHQKKVATESLLFDQNKRRTRDLVEQYDRQLLQRAQFLARLAQSQWDRRARQGVYSIGAIGAPTGAQGYLLLPLWMEEGVEGPLVRRLHRQPLIRVEGADDLVLPRNEEGHYFQIYGDDGEPIQSSRTLKGFALNLEQRDRETLQLLQWRFDRVQLGTGNRLNRVTLKAPVSHFRFERRPPPSPTRSPRPHDRPSPPEGGFIERPSPAIFVQYAIDDRDRREALGKLHADLGEGIHNLEDESVETLAALRRRLWWIGLGTFAAATAGGFLLIGLGLAPLRRLSEAVSRVSPKDFRIPLGPEPLPQELRPIVDRLSATLEQLKRAFAREKQAAADISHELRTPLAALTTTIEVGLRSPRTPEKYGELLQDCRDIARQMSQLVERLLTLERIDAEADALRPQEVDLADVAGQCVALVRPLAEARGVDLRLHAPGPLPFTADPDKVREILTNLLHNAVEYNKPDGRIDVTLGRQNGRMYLDVRDTGIGINPEAREHIFERFYRADQSRHAEGVHAGVGLAIVKGYLDLMGGTVSVDSREGEGTTFHVSLPAKAGPAA